LGWSNNDSDTTERSSFMDGRSFLATSIPGYSRRSEFEHRPTKPAMRARQFLVQHFIRSHLSADDPDQAFFLFFRPCTHFPYLGQHDGEILEGCPLQRRPRRCADRQNSLQPTLRMLAHSDSISAKITSHPLVDSQSYAGGWECISCDNLPSGTCLDHMS